MTHIPVRLHGSAIMVTAMMMIAVSSAQAQTLLKAKVFEAGSRTPIIGATISLKESGKAIAFTDTLGVFSFKPELVGKMVIISYIGYKTQTAKLSERSSYSLAPDVQTIREVVVTAQESRGLSASSTIRQHAMEHLQPSSFTDLLELLPGGRSKDPNLSSPNNIRLREAGGSSSSQYATSSLGTSFLIDGAPISTNANLQNIKGSWEPTATGKDNTSMGVDMRSLSTDDISKVEIVRGIPSVEYGDLTSGLIKIERKRGGTDLGLRLKADMGSKLLYLSKGFELGKHRTLNTSLDYLHSNRDPRNPLESYQRLTASLRYAVAFKLKNYRTDWKLNFDYSGSFDGTKQDPELNGGNEDSFKSSYNRVAISNAFNLSATKSQWLRSLNFLASGSIEIDDMIRTRFIDVQRTTPIVTALTDFEGDAYLLPRSYTATQKAEGRPLNLFTKLNAKISVPSQTIKNSLLVGADWNMDKNYGKGQVFDPYRPLYPQQSLRPRPFSDIPAIHNLSVYAEEHITLSLKRNTIELLAGLRASHLFGLGKEYLMHKRVSLDPRVNIGWTLPPVKLSGKALSIKITAGIGQHSKTPTIGQLYPDPSYVDIPELNYYHPNESLRRIYMRSYVVNNVNTELLSARNLKKEISADLSFDGYRVSVTLFREDMTSGFRSMPLFAPYKYKEYDASSVNALTLTAPPRVEDLPYRERSELLARSYTGNGSRTLKEGIEYTLATKRFDKIRTRLTISGAWFRTTYQNSQPVMTRPNASINNRQIPYVAIYQDVDWSRNTIHNTNFTADTDIPKLQLGFSLSAQCAWFSNSERRPLSEYPNAYMNEQGNVIAWKESDATDPYLRWLIRQESQSNYRNYATPFSLNLNFKVTKKLMRGRINIAMFCNKIWDYSPDYMDNGLVIRRHVDPYFGLETNIKL